MRDDLSRLGRSSNTHARFRPLSRFLNTPFLPISFDERSSEFAICSLWSTKLAKNLYPTILHLSTTWRDGFKNSISLNVSNDNNSSSTINVVQLNVLKITRV